MLSAGFPHRGRRRHGRLPGLPQRVTRPAVGRGAVGSGSGGEPGDGRDGRCQGRSGQPVGSGAGGHGLPGAAAIGRRPRAARGIGREPRQSRRSRRPGNRRGGGGRDRTGPQGSGSHRSSRGSTAQVRGPTPALPFSALFCSALGRPGSRCRLWALLAGLGRGRAAALRPSAGVAPGVPKAVFSLPFDSPFSPRSLLLKASCVGVYGFSVEVVFICFYCFFVPEVGEIILAGGCGVTEMLNSPRARGGFLS